VLITKKSNAVYLEIILKMVYESNCYSKQPKPKPCFARLMATKQSNMMASGKPINLLRI